MTPWLLPEFESLRGDASVGLVDQETPCLESLPEFVDRLDARDAHGPVPLRELRRNSARLSPVTALLPQAAHEPGAVNC